MAPLFRSGTLPQGADGFQSERFSVSKRFLRHAFRPSSWTPSFFFLRQRGAPFLAPGPDVLSGRGDSPRSGIHFSADRPFPVQRDPLLRLFPYLAASLCKQGGFFSTSVSALSFPPRAQLFRARLCSRHGIPPSCAPPLWRRRAFHDREEAGTHACAPPSRKQREDDQIALC